MLLVGLMLLLFFILVKLLSGRRGDILVYLEVPDGNLEIESLRHGLEGLGSLDGGG